jgi:hypothetical protein
MASKQIDKWSSMYKGVDVMGFGVVERATTVPLDDDLVVVVVVVSVLLGLWQTIKDVAAERIAYDERCCRKWKKAGTGTRSNPRE